MDNLEIADRIKKRCKGMKISVKSLLDDCGINHGFIYDLEHKNSAPSIDKINKIANYLDVSVDYLLGRVDNPSPKNYNENPSLNNNTIKILGRDGTNIEKTLTDDEIEVFKKLISSLPDAEDL